MGLFQLSFLGFVFLLFIWFVSSGNRIHTHIIIIIICKNPIYWQKNHKITKQYYKFLIFDLREQNSLKHSMKLSGN